MPVDTVLTIIGKTKDVLDFIIDRLDQLALSKEVATRINERLEHLKQTIRKIEPHIKKDSDTKELEQFLTHLENIVKSCTDITNKNKIIKFVKIAGDMLKLNTLEAEIKMAESKLMLFMNANELVMLSESNNLYIKKLDKMLIFQENNMAGINIVEDKSIRKPPAPLGFTIQENKNELKLSWKPIASRGVVENYQVCYDASNNSYILVKNDITTLGICPPRIQPGKVYTMKVRGVNKGGDGEWSNSMVGKLTKPFPQAPKISDIQFRATIAVITVKLAEATCSTESPVTSVEISYAIAKSGNKLSHSEFEIVPGKHAYFLTVTKLHPDTEYIFGAKARNAEGWSGTTDSIEGFTLSLPPNPAKPSTPIVKICSPTKVNLTVEVPENTCGIKSPITAWRVTGCSGDKEKVAELYPINTTSFMEKSINLPVSNLNPNQQYTLEILAKNERGWSEPSEKFKIHINSTPSVPENIRVSSKRSHSLIKIRWNEPDSCLITHYEIIKRTTKIYYVQKPIRVPSSKFSATFTKLKQSTKYFFKVRSCNGIHASDWSEEIEANTRIHKGIKAALSPAVWAAGTVASPFAVPIVGGLLGKESGGKKGAVAGVAVGTVSGMTLGIAAAPVFGTGLACAFVQGIDCLSDQSDDEDAVIIES